MTPEQQRRVEESQAGTDLPPADREALLEQRLALFPEVCDALE